MNKEIRRCEWCGDIAQGTCGCQAETEIERLRAALVPLANASFSHERAEITAADCERARLALYGHNA